MAEPVVKLGSIISHSLYGGSCRRVRRPRANRRRTIELDLDIAYTESATVVHWHIGALNPFRTPVSPVIQRSLGYL